ncbi:MAG: sigma-70 family RNA polymerase sigma factor, partial [Flavobacteriales bacterium]|nr:sigma-70 family RNA polymerase sigma factor [Flavobacteriales bacterium]
ETRGFKFISYAVWWIRQGIAQSIAENSRTVRLPLNQVSNMQKVKRAVAELEQKNEREPTAEELSEVLNFSIEAVETSIRNTPLPISINTPVNHMENVTLQDSLKANTDANPDAGLMLESINLDIQQMLSRLSNLEKDILVDFYGLCSTPPLSLSTIASNHNLTTERIRQIKQVALKKMRNSN